MKFKVEITKADYDAFTAHTASRLMKPHRWIPILKNVVLWLILGVMFTSFFQFLSGKVESKFFYTVLMVFIPFFIYVLLGILMAQKITKCCTPNLNGIMIGSKVIDVDTDGIKESHRLGYNFYQWDAVERVEEVNDSVYVFVDGVLALIFNAACFESNESKTELINTVKKHL